MVSASIMRPGRHWTWCPVHAKRGFHYRDGARVAIRNLNQPGMREYRCDQRDVWHIGHLPRDVRSGRRTATDIYGRCAS